jgi:Na+-driven multidrug efflux pump
MSDFEIAILDLEEKADFSHFLQSQFQNAPYVRPSFEIGSLYKEIYFMKQNTTYYFEEAPVPRSILHFGVPTMVAMLVFIFYNLVDTFYIGLLKDVNAMAGVTLAIPLFTLLMGIGNVLGIGCGTFISRLLGKKDHTAVKNASAFSFYAVLICGVIITALGFLFRDFGRIRRYP